MPWLKGLLVAGLLGMSVAAPAQEVACREPFKPMLRSELYFGRYIADQRGVSEKQWTAFLKRELAPRFPDGLTVLDAQGQWRDPAGATLVREPSKLVIVVTVDDAGVRERLAAVVAAYKQRFKQTSVGVVTRAVCAAF